MHRIHLSTVQVELYGASPSLQIAQSEENPVAPPISQLQVVENHQMYLPIVFQVTEDGCSQMQSKDLMRRRDVVMGYMTFNSQGWATGKNVGCDHKY